MSDLPLNPVSRLRIIWAGILIGLVFLLGVFVALGSGTEREGSGVLGIVSVFVVAVLTPVAVLLRGEGLVGAELPADPAEQQRRAPRHILFFGLLDAAALLCGIAFMVEGSALALGAAVLPLAVLALNFPRAAAG